MKRFRCVHLETRSIHPPKLNCKLKRRGWVQDLRHIASWRDERGFAPPLISHSFCYRFTRVLQLPSQTCGNAQSCKPWPLKNQLRDLIRYGQSENEFCPCIDQRKIARKSF